MNTTSTPRKVRWAWFVFLALFAAGILAGCGTDKIASLPEAQGEATPEIPIGIGTATDNSLYLINLLAGTATLIGPTGIGLLEGLAVSSTLAVFGTDSGGNLFSIDPATGAASSIGSTGLGNIEGLDFNGAVLIGSTYQQTPTIVSIDTTTGVASSIVTASVSTGYPHAMTVLDSNTVLIATDNAGKSELWRVDLVTGTANLIGTMTIPGSPSQSPLGMDFGSNGLLYGLNSDGTLMVIDPATAAVSIVGDSGNLFWLNFAAAP